MSAQDRAARRRDSPMRYRPDGTPKPRIQAFRPWPECDHLLYQASIGDGPPYGAGGSARDAYYRLMDALTAGESTHFPAISVDEV